MSDPILDALGAVRAQISELAARLDSMVTRREHDAEVRRIDAEAERTRESLLRHETDATRRLAEIESVVESRVDEVLAAVEKDRAERKADRHWLVGIVVAACSAAVALGQLLTRWL